MPQLTSGVKIAVDSSEIDVKFLKSAEALNASLTKTQKSLGLTYNEQGLLTNALGQCVEGLSAAQIRLGEYVDELGTLHTYQGGLVEGLNKSQVAMGMYSDELGNVYDKTGALVGQTSKAAKAIEKEAAEAAQRAAKSLNELAKSADAAAKEIDKTTAAFRECGGAVSAVGGMFKTLGGALGENGEAFGKFGDVLGKVGQTAQQFGATLKGLKEGAQYVKGLNDKIGGLKNAPQMFKALGGSASKALAMIPPPALAAIAAIAAVAVAVYAVKKIIDHFNPVEELSEQFKELEERAKKAGKNIENVKDALQVGAFAKGVEGIADAAKRYEEATRAFDEAAKNAKNDMRYGTGLIGAVDSYILKRRKDDAANKQKNALAELNAQIAPVMEQARANAKTAAEKLAQQVKDLDAALAAAIQAEASAEDRAALEKERARIAKLQAEAEAEEWAEKKGLAEIMREAEAAIKAARPYQDEAAQLQADLDARLAEGKLSQEKYNEACRILAEKAQAAAAKEIGIDAPQMPPIPPELKPQMDAITEQFKNGALSLDQLNEATTRAREEFEKAKLAEAAQRSAEQLEAGEISAEQHAANMAAISIKQAEEAKKRGGIVAALEQYRADIAAGNIDQKTANEEIAKLQEERARELKESKATLEEWNAAAGRGEVAQKAAAEAIEEFKEAAEEARDKARTKLAEELGVELGPEKKTLNYQEKVKALQEALEKGNATQEDYNATLKRLQEAEQERLAQETGAIFEKKKELDALAKYEDGAEKLKKALDEGAITQEAYNEGLESLRDAAKEAAPITLERFKEERKRLQEAKRAGELDEEEYKKRLEILKGAATKGQEGLEALLKREKELDPLKKAEEDHAALMKQIDEAEKARLYSREQIEKMRDAADVDLAKAREAAAKEERARLDKMRGELGIDKLLEDMKSPLDKYRETMDKIAEAAGEGAISSDEAALLQAKAEDDYWTKMGDVAEKSKEKLDKANLGQSMASGSGALYSAMAKMNNGNFQNRVQAATERLANTQAAALATLQQINYNLTDADGGVATFAGR